MHPARPPRVSFPDSVRFLTDPLGWSPILYRKYGAVVQLSELTKSLICVFHPGIAHEISVQYHVFVRMTVDNLPLRFAPDTAAYRMLAGMLSLQNGDKHRALRRELLSALDANHLKEYLVTTQEKACPGLQRLSMDGAYQDLGEFCHQLAMQVSFATLFGFSQNEETLRLFQCFRAWLSEGFSPWVVIFPFDLPFSPYRRILAASEKLERQLLRTLNHQKESRHSLIKVVFGEDWKNGITQESTSRIAGYLQASYEPIANTLFWTIVLLNRYPEAASRVLREIQALDQAELSLYDLSRLPYTRAVVLESIRLIPPILISPRYVAEGADIDGFRFEPGDRVMVGPALSHRVPAAFASPLHFDPNRFHESTDANFSGFGTGLRRCPGEQFGMNAVLVLLYHWLSHSFPEIKTGSHIRTSGLIISNPQNAVPFRPIPVGAHSRLAVKMSGKAIRNLD
jgi:cytochrome P450